MAWEDPWIPAGDTRRPRTLRGKAIFTKVADLINPITGGWDEQLVQDHFDPAGAQAILSISICDSMDDNLAWHFDPKEVFSVKSAYKLGVMLRDRMKGREAACSRESTQDSVVKFNWKKIWDLRAPNKLKMFVWRLAHNSLVSRMKIMRMGVDLDTACPLCHRLNEDGGHIFLKCKMAKACWNSLGLGATRERLLPCSLAHNMLEELWKRDTNVQLKALVLTWEWWSVRNKANSGEAVASYLDVCHRVERHMMDFIHLKLPAIPPKPPDQHKWVKPPDNQ
uniref:Uncharacterized protein n=1 Tax=Avena sativa TaxID=4498 RepID=A0ACD5UP38_AVESA